MKDEREWVKKERKEKKEEKASWMKWYKRKWRLRDAANKTHMHLQHHQNSPSSLLSVERLRPCPPLQHPLPRWANLEFPFVPESQE